MLCPRTLPDNPLGAIMQESGITLSADAELKGQQRLAHVFDDDGNDIGGIYERVERFYWLHCGDGTCVLCMGVHTSLCQVQVVPTSCSFVHSTILILTVILHDYLLCIV